LVFLSKDGFSLLEEHFGIPPVSLWQCTVERIAHLHRVFDSRIISDFPEIFAEFQRKRFSVLWRGSRDGFEAKEFHRRCDGRRNTLTLVLDTKGNIFGGFTPVEWESPMNLKMKPDDSLKSFLFTLKNPHLISAKRFALKPEKKHQAIGCRFDLGPMFAQDFGIVDNCNKKDTGWASYTGHFGDSYNNDTGLETDFFTGGWNFYVEEIEVFEILG
jgi:hypothetical protein